jgi:tetratricopeptide (TPR) repeat protein
MAGRPDFGAEKVSQGLSNTGTNAAVQFLRARLLQADLGAGDGVESVAAYRDVLAANPRNLVALANLQRNAMLHGDVAEAKNLQDQMAKAGASPAQVAVDRGVLHLAQGQTAEARKAFASAAAMDKCPPTVWVATGVLALQEKDEELLAQAIEQLKKLPNFVPGLIFRADLSMQRGNAEAAREAYGQALGVEPFNRVALERLMTLNFLQRDMATARKLAGQLLNLDANNAAANYVMGTIFFSEGSNDLAEAALRRSVLARPNGPALNDLAWLLQNKNQLDEALQFSSQAIQLAPTQPLFWSTHGLILSKQKKTAQAAEAFDRALNFGLKHPEALIVAATVYVQVQRPDAARRALAIIGETAGPLGPAQKKAFDQLTARLAETSASAAPPATK